MKILNLGCGTKTSDKSEVVNIDWSIYLRLRRLKLFDSVASLFFKGDRLDKLSNLPDNIMVYNLANGIPFDAESVDVVYHSHLFEHLDREVAEQFLIEVKRVLKPGGIHRIVVPDFERACKAYIAHLEESESSTEESEKHDSFFYPILEQSVRKEAYGTSIQKPFKRYIENIVLGDARKRGETHQWMYDRINLKVKLLHAGYKEVHTQNYTSSLIPNWQDYGLDTDMNGQQYKPGSLYIEAVK